MSQDLIIVIVDKYKDEEVMAAAKSAGATGGSILHGRGCKANERKWVFDILVEPEKEVVFILSESDNTEKIVAAVDQKLQLSKGNNGLLFVVDVMDAVGLKG